MAAAGDPRPGGDSSQSLLRHGHSLSLSPIHSSHQSSQGLAGSRLSVTPDRTAPSPGKSYVSYNSSIFTRHSPGLVRANVNNTATWGIEVAGLLISLASFASIIVILSIEDGRKLVSWSFYFSLNTVIAALGTLWRASLTFGVGASLGQQKWNWFATHDDEIETFNLLDAASKGPWGSFVLLLNWSKRILRSWAILGVIAVLLAVVTDPFFQESVSYNGRLDLLVDTNSTSSIGRSANLNKGQIFFQQATYATVDSNRTYPSINFYGFSTIADLALASSIYLGFDDTAVQRPAASTCTTGNCTWPLYNSLAICSHCQDVSDYIVVSTGEAYASAISDQVLETTAPLGQYWTNYSLPYSHIRHADDPMNVNKNKQPEPDSLFLTVNVTTNYQHTIAFRDNDTLMTAFLIMRAGKGYLNEGRGWNESKPEATECALTLCVKTYNSSLINGQLTENVVDSWFQRDPNSWSFADYVGPVSQVGTREDYLRLTNHRPSLSHQALEDRALRSDLTLLLPAAKNRMNTGDEKFNVSQQTIASLQDTLLTWSVGKFDGNNSVIAYPYAGVGTRPMYPLAEIMWNSRDNLTGAFSRLATSLSNGMRNTDISFRGDASQYEYFIHVQWTFLIVPGVVAACGTIYIMVIIVQTTRARLPAWKDEITPVLAYGLTQEEQQYMRDMYLARRPEPSWKTVEKLQIRFDRQEGLRLRVGGQVVP